MKGRQEATEHRGNDRGMGRERWTRTGVGLASSRAAKSPQTTQRRELFHLHLGQRETSAVAENAYKYGHEVLFPITKVLHHSEQAIHETLKIRLHPNVMNRDEGLQIHPA